jgi:hypothetical protein
MRCLLLPMLSTERTVCGDHVAYRRVVDGEVGETYKEGKDHGRHPMRRWWTHTRPCEAKKTDRFEESKYDKWFQSSLRCQGVGSVLLTKMLIAFEPRPVEKICAGTRR